MELVVSNTIAQGDNPRQLNNRLPSQHKTMYQHKKKYLLHQKIHQLLKLQPRTAGQTWTQAKKFLIHQTADDRYKTKVSDKTATISLTRCLDSGPSSESSLHFSAGPFGQY